MNNIILNIISAILLSLALCLDSFVTAFSYSASKIKLPILSILIIDVLCTAVLLLGMLMSTLTANYIDGNITGSISAMLLMSIGTIKLFYGPINSIFNCNKNSLSIGKLLNAKFITNLLNNGAADVNHDKVLSLPEASSLALALSLDGFATGISVGLSDIDMLTMSTTALIIGLVALSGGSALGKLAARKSTMNLSWISGAILIIMGALKLL